MMHRLTRLPLSHHAGAFQYLLPALRTEVDQTLLTPSSDGGTGGQEEFSSHTWIQDRVAFTSK
jgi:hypothetical protein